MQPVQRKKKTGLIFLYLKNFTLYVTDAPKKILQELRICTIHFPEEKIYKDTQRRRLKNHTVPTEHLAHIEITPIATTSSTSNNTCCSSNFTIININSVTNIVSSTFITTNSVNNDFIHEEIVQCNPNSEILQPACKKKIKFYI